jgi:hypothetical protein
MTDYADLTPSQRPAQLVFWYESEVQNGGHLQYFINRGDDHSEETIQALHSLGARGQARVLAQAVALWRSAHREASVDAEVYVEEALEDEFGDLDKAFHACPENLASVLQRHLAVNEPEFIARDPKD